ncbi:MAG: HAD family hydrolase [Symploca sp. SIO3C6]|uniref:HAD family hydrolase n=1 Tax=Symploca sp. SIO1C4 TaxID=2607765 RepID=A0A6B3N670_9CYAN|nr:HAD family hydrolase [Symploca sp. SIO3C6]NER28629.1 HAD family hydrolase [Symploca sp. SIO1C4]NET06515.1 HAD family hydrolase [Symploca sp. SIO2B6]
MQQPKVIFLDAVGTLFGVRGSVGEVYGMFAREYGVKVKDASLNNSFLRAFKSAKPPVFPGADPDEIPEQEFEWWRMIALRTFEDAGVLEQFVDFTDFFDQLYHHFATAKPWFIYPDVIPALEKWQAVGIGLGIVSNFDSRLHFVLKELKLDKFFTSITISTFAGAAKPEPQIFATALQKHHCQPQEAWHIGDSYQQDYQGARAAGLRAILIDR